MFGAWRSETVAEQVSVSDKVRILVVGDSGVGKTTLVHRICYDCLPKSSSWTIGCTVHAKIYTHSVSQRLFFIEFIDIGGSPKYAKSRQIFYRNIDGVMFVHDLTNRKSFNNLRKWILEVRDFPNVEARNHHYNPSLTPDRHSFTSPHITRRHGGSREDARESILEEDITLTPIHTTHTPAVTQTPATWKRLWGVTSWFRGSQVDSSPRSSASSLFDVEGGGPSNTSSTPLLSSRDTSLPCLIVGNKLDHRRHRLPSTGSRASQEPALARDNVEISAIWDQWDARVMEPFLESVIESRYSSSHYPHHQKHRSRHKIEMPTANDGVGGFAP